MFGVGPSHQDDTQCSVETRVVAKKAAPTTPGIWGEQRLSKKRRTDWLNRKISFRKFPVNWNIKKSDHKSARLTANICLFRRFLCKGWTCHLSNLTYRFFSTRSRFEENKLFEQYFFLTNHVAISKLHQLFARKKEMIVLQLSVSFRSFNAFSNFLIWRGIYHEASTDVVGWMPFWPRVTGHGAVVQLGIIWWYSGTAAHGMMIQCYGWARYIDTAGYCTMVIRWYSWKWYGGTADHNIVIQWYDWALYGNTVVRLGIIWWYVGTAEHGAVVQLSMIWWYSHMAW